MAQEQFVVDKYLLSAGPFDFKTYVFDSVRDIEEAETHIKDCMNHPIFPKIKQSMCHVGVAFLYGYEVRYVPENTPDYVRGADLLFFRNPESINAMKHKVSIEEGILLDSLLDGAGCTTGGDIEALENKVRLSIINSGWDVEKYKHAWPDISEYMLKT